MMTSQEREERVRQDLRRAYRVQLPGDYRLVLLGHGALIILVTILLWNDVSEARLAVWAAVVLMATFARSLWSRKAAHPEASDRSVLSGARGAVVLQGLAWSAGAALLMNGLPMPSLALLLLVIAGIGAGSLATLAPDAPSFYGFLAALSVPLPFGILAAAVDRPHLVAAFVVVVFATVLVSLYRSAHEALSAQMLTTILLSDGREAQARLIGELRTALGAVKQLTGLLPICASCKKVRDDFGYWNSVEHYISSHTDAKFSHGVCPDCFPKLFPGIPLPEPEEQHV
jgi:hypothetical protein